jgi:eukaryotic-like serine/threonine-protein kinase
MQAERWLRIKSIFHDAVEQPPGERAAYVRSRCDGDEALASEIECLLAAHDQATSFIEAPAADSTIEAETEPSEQMIGRRIGAYELTGEIGRGGMGTVYLAERADGLYRKSVAVKLARCGTGSDFIIQRFRNERRILASLDHPNIARLLDGGATEDGVPYFVMEYVYGKSIVQYCEDNALPIRERLNLFLSVCSAVAYAHQCSIVHRDIKPSNILVSSEGLPKLLDFGIAKLLEPEPSSNGDSTATALRLMTPEYASPEQVRGDPVTPASDVYALGVLLYQLLTGRLPYRLKSRQPHELAHAICEQEPEKPSTAVTIPEEARNTSNRQMTALTGKSAGRSQRVELKKLRKLLDGDLDRIVLMALQKQPEQRYDSVGEFSEEIRRHLEGLPVRVPKLGPSLSLARFRSRWKAGLAAAMVAAILLGALIVYSPPWKRPAASRSARSIAVLPFKSISQETGDDYLGQGLADALITRLTNVTQMIVRPTSSVRKYAGIEQDATLAGRELGVESVVEGTIQRTGDRIRVTVQLVNIQDGAPRWAAQFDEKLIDMLSVEDSISTQIASALSVTLTEQERIQLARRYTENSEAYQAYLKGRYFWNKRTPESYRKAIDYFDRAVEIDSGFALAYTGIADSYTMLENRYGMSGEEAFPKAEEAANTALTIDDTLAEAHASMGLIRDHAHSDLKGAIVHFKRAIELSPNYPSAHGWYGVALTRLGDFERSEVELRRAQELDPTSLNIALNLAQHYLYSRQYDRAIEEAKKGIELDPNLITEYLVLSIAYEEKGMYDQAVDAALKTILFASHPESIAPLKQAYRVSGIRGFWRKEIEILQGYSLKMRGLEVSIARRQAKLGDYDLAMNELEKGYRNQSSRLLYAKVDPAFDGMRSDPRFIDLLQRIGLEP